MKGLELNKIMAALLVPGIIVLFISNFVDILYKPDEVKSEYSVPATEASSNTAPAVEVDINELLMTANLEKGKKLSTKCASCHTFNKGGINKIGPNLWNIVGAKKAHLDSFNYSKAMASKGGIWDYEQLSHYLKSPQRFVVGTKMSFAGISKPMEVADLILYLRSMSDNPPPITK